MFVEQPDSWLLSAVKCCQKHEKPNKLASPSSWQALWGQLIPSTNSFAAFINSLATFINSLAAFVMVSLALAPLSDPLFHAFTDSLAFFTGFLASRSLLRTCSQKWGLFSPTDSAQCDSAQQFAGLNKKRRTFGVHVFVNKQDFRARSRAWKIFHWAEYWAE